MKKPRETASAGGHAPGCDCPTILSQVLSADPAHQEHLAVLRHEKVKRPTIYVGTGTCGLGAGARFTVEAIKDYLKQHDIEADLIEVGCIGLCSAEPIVDIQLPGKARVSFKGVTKDKVAGLLDAMMKATVPGESVIGQHRTEFAEMWPDAPCLDEHPFFAPQKRWVLANCGIMDPASIDEYIARGGYTALARVLSGQTPEQVCDSVEASGLRGRGGGGFPTGKKWKFARSAPGAQKYLVCNADEGDPGAFMDRAVIEGDPHRLLEGMAIAAYAIGAGKAYVYIRAEYPLAIERLKAAIKQARGYRLLGEKILGHEFSLEIVIKMGAGAFVCGEETALMASIEGRRGMPKLRPPYPAVKGLWSRPTLINNVETYAAVSWILRNGADAYAAIGTDKSKGTKVFALAGKVARGGLIEVPMGTSIRQIVDEIGGGVAGGLRFKAVQVGGPSGGCIPVGSDNLSVDYESLTAAGAMMGSGGLVVLDETDCMVDIARYFLQFTQNQSCGKCTFCRIGTRRMLDILDRLCAGQGKADDLDELQHLAEMIKKGSLCGLGKTAPNPVLSTLRYFREEYEAHIQKRCPAGKCKALITYSITDDCIGCTICAQHCPTGAIEMKPYEKHEIDPNKCVRCGTCKSVCPADAVRVE